MGLIDLAKNSKDFLRWANIKIQSVFFTLMKAKGEAGWAENKMMDNLDPLEKYQGFPPDIFSV